MDMVERLVAALEQLTKEQKQGGLHTKAPGSVNSSMLLQQPGGMFTVTGLDNEFISLNVSPKGLGAVIPAMPASVDDPRYGFLVGFSDDIGSEPVGPCDDAPRGYMKAASLTATWGRIARQTETIEIDKLLHTKRGVTTDLRLMNEALGGDVGFDTGSSFNQEDMLNLVVKAEMVNVGVRLERKLSRMVWTGTPANNTAQGGYKEFVGLDNQIATGHVDADNGQAVVSADSTIMDFGGSLVNATTKDIVEYMSMMEFYLFNLAEKQNLNPVTWAVVMRPELWFELSSYWPCRYLTNRCSEISGTSPMVINDNVNVAMRDAMRNGNYIDINGRRYPVVVDDGIFEKTNINTAGVPAGSYQSSVYFVPLRVRGSFPVLYWEYIDYRDINRQLAPIGAGQRNVPFWTDTGRYLWVYRENGFCFDLQVKLEPRLVLRTPHLAGKLQNIRYTPLMHLRSPYPDSPYWKDGGVSLRPQQTNYAVWGNFNV